MKEWRHEAYSSILGALSIAALESDTMTLVLQTLRSDQTLNLGSFGVWFLAFTLWLDLTTDNELADLKIPKQNFVSVPFSCLTLCIFCMKQKRDRR